MKHATINDAPAVLNRNDQAMWVLGFNEAVEQAAALRGKFGVAVALLRECLGPLEVSAALIESDDGDQMEALIRHVRGFVEAVASGVEGRKP